MPGVAHMLHYNGHKILRAQITCDEHAKQVQKLSEIYDIWSDVKVRKMNKTLHHMFRVKNDLILTAKRE